MKQQRFRILICDTDVETLIGLERMLEDAGFDTTTTWDVTDLARCSECDFFHLLIVGDHPPQMDAEAILKDLRGKDLRGIDVSCVVLKWDVSACDSERLRSAGTTAVVSRRNYASILEQAKACLGGYPKCGRRVKTEHSIECAKGPHENTMRNFVKSWMRVRSRFALRPLIIS